MCISPVTKVCSPIIKKKCLKRWMCPAKSVLVTDTSKAEIISSNTGVSSLWQSFHCYSTKVNRNNLAQSKLTETFLTSLQCKWRNIFHPFVEKRKFTINLPASAFFGGMLFPSLLNSFLKLVLLCSLPYFTYPSAIRKKHFPLPFCLHFTFSALTMGLWWLRRKEGVCHLSYRRHAQPSILFPTFHSSLTILSHCIL